MSRTRRPWTLGHLRAAVGRRVRGPYATLDRIEQRTATLERQIEALDDKLASRLAENAGLHNLLRADLHAALIALAANETVNRSLLASIREEPDYEQAWSDERPLISVTVATLGRPQLTSVSLPSILNQSHRELEVIVAGDGAGPDVEKAVRATGDSRVRYLDLGPRQTWTDDQVKLWLVGATRPRNAAVQAARGRWIVEFDDDDEMRPNCLERLIAHARRTRAEAVYGRIHRHQTVGQQDIGEFPPRLGQFSWAAGMYHAGLRFFGRELLAADLGLPGDWWLAERMLRAGVRFAMEEEVLCDAYESDRLRTALEGGRFPWDVHFG